MEGFDSIFKLMTTQKRFKVGTHEGTSPCDWSLRLVPGTKSLRVHYPFKSKNVVAGTNIWSLRLVPRIQTCLNSWDQSRRLVPHTMLGPFACTVRGTSPCDQMKIFHRIFYFFPVDIVCTGSLD